MHLPPPPTPPLDSATGSPSYQTDGSLSEAADEPTNLSELRLEDSSQLSTQTPPSSISATTSRKRVKTTAASATRRASSAVKPEPPSSVVPLPPSRTRRETISNDQVIDALRTCALFVFDVLSIAFRLLKAPLAFLVFLGFLAIAFSSLKPLFRQAFNPACAIPGVSSTALCLSLAHPDLTKGTPQRADFPRLVDVQSATFDQVLSESVSGSALAMEIKDAEMATSNLVSLIRKSDLEGRDELANVLEELVQDARKTGRGLQKLSAKVGGAVDRIIAVNNHALRTIEKATRESESFSLVAFIWPFSLTSAKHANEVVTRTFIDALGQLETQMGRLIHEAHTNIGNLDRLEAGMTAFYENVVGMNATLEVAQSQLLAELWTRLGGNKATLLKQQRHLHILGNVGTYTQQARLHVSQAWVALNGMMESMEDIKESVTEPESERTPIEVHVESIKAGLDRLQHGKRRALEREDAAYRRKEQEYY